MEFNEKTLKDAGFTDEEVQWVNNKNTGGETGGAGYDYQKFYAVHRLLCSTTGYLDHGQDFGAKEQEFCFIDDLVFVNGSPSHEFCQSKTNQNTTWGYKDGKLKKEFRSQKRLCEYYKINFHLRIVTHDEKIQKGLIKNVPLDLQGCTSIECFPKIKIIWDLADLESPSFQALMDLNASRMAPENACKTIAAVFFVAWMNRDPAEYLYVSEIIASALASDENLPIRQNLPYPEGWIGSQISLMQIPDLSVILNNGFCYYVYGNERGRIARQGTPSFDRFLKRILDDPPTNFEEFMEHVP